MRKKERSQEIHRILDRLYPETPVPLDHSDPYTLLIAVLLSAQCTDERVNKVTPALFDMADTPQKMILHTPEDIRQIIRPCGLSPTKSKNIQLFRALDGPYSPKGNWCLQVRFYLKCKLFCKNSPFLHC